MTPNQYQEAASRTSLPSYSRLDVTLPSMEQQLIHAHLGISSEAGEIGDCLKKYFIYGQYLDADNLVEECGDILWYVALMLTSCGVTLEECMTDNIEKLRIRYPEKFTEELAAKRLDKQP